ncbi:MAG: hypothetical protein IKL10_03425 [Clostridia bacterium]|nr:hypothetical protein [Clostridia bacterium]
MKKEETEVIVKSEEFVKDCFQQIEKMIDEKLSNLKAFTPILLTIITSIVAFLFVAEVGTEETGKLYMFAIGILLIAFGVLIYSYFPKNHYKNMPLKTKEKFSVFDLNSYCFLNDEKYINELCQYFGRHLYESEESTALFLKQKINEYVYRKIISSIVLGVLMAGSLVLALILIMLAVYPQIFELW